MPVNATHIVIEAGVVILPPNDMMTAGGSFPIDHKIIINAVDPDPEYLVEVLINQAGSEDAARGEFVG